MSNELQTIPINSLYESPENSRQVFDKRNLEELAQSIQAQGIKVRLIVRPYRPTTFRLPPPNTLRSERRSRWSLAAAPQ